MYVIAGFPCQMFPVEFPVPHSSHLHICTSTLLHFSFIRFEIKEKEREKKEKKERRF